MNSKRPWNSEDIATLRYSYAARGAAWCANKLGCSVGSIENKAHRIGISTSKYGSAEPLGPAIIRTTRRCTDCGKPTADYRCPACKEKHLKKHRANMDGFTPDETYKVLHR